MHLAPLDGDLSTRGGMPQGHRLENAVDLDRDREFHANPLGNPKRQGPDPKESAALELIPDFVNPNHTHRRRDPRGIKRDDHAPGGRRGCGVSVREGEKSPTHQPPKPLEGADHQRQRGLDTPRISTVPPPWRKNPR
jgi:hypothetical protein